MLNIAVIATFIPGLQLYFSIAAFGS